MTTKGLGGTDSAWERLAQSDPLWAILSDPAKRGGGWNLEDFLATGEAEVAALMEYVSRIAPNLPRDRALDFGCGVGRVTAPLAMHFASVVGVDISPTMIEAAKSRAHDAAERAGACEYLLNSGPKLDSLEDGSFDFVYSSITLQHIPGLAALGYLAEFVRLLKPEGLAVFQFPARRRPSIKKRLSWLLPQSLRAKRHSGIEMHGALRGDVLSALAMAGGEVVDVQRDTLAGPQWESYRYAATKR
jgi:SAM-dependent methyltransferase